MGFFCARSYSALSIEKNFLFYHQAFGFCEYNNPDAGLRAIRIMNGFEIADDKKLVVKVDAKTRKILDDYLTERIKKAPPAANNKEAEKRGEEGDKDKEDKDKKEDEVGSVCTVCLVPPLASAPTTQILRVLL